MDLALLIVTAVASVAAVASAVVAIVQARAAKASEGDAIIARDEARKARDESAHLAAQATAAFIRQADAQERANAIKEAEMREPPWSATHFSGDTYRMANTSGRALKVESVEIDPEEATGWVHIDPNVERIYELGQSFDFMYSTQFGVTARRLIVTWHYADEPDAQSTEFIVRL